MFFGLFKKKAKVVKVKRKKKIKKTIKRKKSPKPKVRKTQAKRVKKVRKPAKVIPQIVGKVTHYFPRVKAGVILASDTISLGDTIQIKGHTTDFKQKVTSIQINNLPIKEAKSGDEIGLLVKTRVRANDVVYKLS